MAESNANTFSKEMTGGIDMESLERIDPKALNSVIQFAQLGQMTRIRRALEKQEADLAVIKAALLREQFVGQTYEKELLCNDQHQWYDLTKDAPLIPFIAAVFVNDDLLNNIYVSINDPDYPFTVKPRETHPLDFSKADKRIYFIFYWCDKGLTAKMRAIGKY